MKKNNIVPAISVLIPVYNVEEYLEECVESVLKQSLQDFEIILVDDCSSDNSRNICKKLEGNDKRIKVIYHKNNRGVSAARNTCLRAAIGKYIAYVDSDDIIKPEYLMEMYQLAEKYDADVVATGGTEYKLNEKGEWVEGVKIELANENLILTEDITERMANMAQYKFSPNIWSKLINRRVFVENEICRFEAIQFEDVLFHFPLLYSAKRYILSPCNSYLYRQSPESICRGSNLEKTKKAMRSILGCMKSVDKYMVVGDSSFYYLNKDDEVANMINVLKQGSGILLKDFIMRERKKEEEAVPAPKPEDIALLEEIRDLLKEKK